MRQTRGFVFIGAAAIALSALCAARSYADTPVVNITAPTGTIYVSSFPLNTSITFTITHPSLNDLQVLDVLVDGTSLFSEPVGDPFDSGNQCKSPNLTSVSTSCSTDGSDNANVTIPWTVPSAGTYTVTISIKHRNLIGEDTEDVTFSLVAIEYPAPPSVANAYINKTWPKSSAKVRGCVISQIADNHAKYSTYGPKGGPYNTRLIETDVNGFWAGCGGQ